LIKWIAALAALRCRKRLIASFAADAPNETLRQNPQMREGTALELNWWERFRWKNCFLASKQARK
jgi:hypothetical protein